MKYLGINKENIEIIEKDGKLYALHGWNGLQYLDCFTVNKYHQWDKSLERYTMTPVWDTSSEDELDWFITDYEISIN